MGIKTVILRSDNAGAYHSSSLVASLYNVEKETHVKIERYTYSEPQAGKSDCDRMISHLKRKLSDYLQPGKTVHSGQNVETLEEMFAALTTGRLLKGVSVHLIDYNVEQKSGFTFDGIRSFGDFEYGSDGVTARRHFYVGSGVYKKKNDLKPIILNVKVLGNGGDALSSLTTVTDERRRVLAGEATRFWFTRYKGAEIEKKAKEEENAMKAMCDSDDRWEDEFEPTIDTSPQNEACEKTKSKLYTCPIPGCRATFLRQYPRDQHVLAGKHNFAPDQETMLDYAANLYVDELEGGDLGNNPLPELDNAIRDSITVDPQEAAKTQEPIGFAVKKQKTNKPFPEKVRKYLTERFIQGIVKKQKDDPKVVAKEMKTQKDQNGNKIFEPSEYLTWQQITSFFSQLNSKQVKLILFHKMKVILESQNCKQAEAPSPIFVNIR
ncbi:hypothetical protein WR25_04779 isoform B [Diploscapter pachys]|uniref:C2H2-type domain-containing protein n=1 Tax=Diploscapter pachys TaxID=2018661 RepID=A0A2A2L4B0_9BILA|nr:hypothetical protein WR25_04779 isoform B [Diploscapter pachys]